MSASVTFRCPSCQARIKAPLALIGQTRNCPGCRNPFIVPSLIAEDEGPLLLLDSRPAYLDSRENLRYRSV